MLASHDIFASTPATCPDCLPDRGCFSRDAYRHCRLRARFIVRVVRRPFTSPFKHFPASASSLYHALVLAPARTAPRYMAMARCTYAGGDVILRRRTWLTIHFTGIIPFRTAVLFCSQRCYNAHGAALCSGTLRTAALRMLHCLPSACDDARYGMILCGTATLPRVGNVSMYAFL